MERFRDLPVSVELPGAFGQEVARYVETEGWQVVAPGGPPAPVLTLADRPVAERVCVVLVEGSPTPEQVREGLRAGALDVLGWPAERARLLDLPGHLTASSGPSRQPGVLGVAGAAGGAGTSTVALALAALAAWRGLRTAVVGGPDLLALCGIEAWAGPGADELVALGPAGAAAEFAAVARPLPGLDDLSVLSGDGAALTGCDGWPVDLVVADRRQALDVRGPGRPAVVVARPDASLGRAAGLGAAGLVLVSGRGPLDPAGVRRRLGRRPDATLPHSIRVARAGLAGRVPSGLPGSYLEALRRPFAPLRRAS